MSALRMISAGAERDPSQAGYGQGSNLAALTRCCLCIGCRDKIGRAELEIWINRLNKQAPEFVHILVINIEK